MERRPMAEIVNPPAGTATANGNAGPFANASPGHAGPLRYGAFDSAHFSALSSSSPSSARRALEAHMRDTERRIKDAARLGMTLTSQRAELASKLKEVEQMQQDTEIPAELQSRLAELEREYNEVGRESARSFLPKSRVASESVDWTNSTIMSGSGRDSPTKMTVPSRRQRNQPTNRVHDIEFATEISTSLLAQVRQLQAALAEKDEQLKDTTSAKAQLEAESAQLLQRLRHMDESEQKYKDENWNLETRLQDIEANLRESLDKEQRLSQSLKLAQADKAAKERELDELRLSHEKLSEDQANARKITDNDFYTLQRDHKSQLTENEMLQAKVRELTSQNTELARGLAFRMGQQVPQSDTDFMSAEENPQSDDASPDHSAPTSPIKGTPARHGMLESETLKSSLNHAHRMIQNLKNNIHREKTEKIELKRMLQDARDELEQKRDSTGIIANVAKKRKSENDFRYKRPTSSRLGASRASTTEIIDEPDWEDDLMEQTPSRGRDGIMSRATVAGLAAATAYNRAYGKSDGDTTDAAFETANETDTGFETATERGATTESEAFATGAEDLGEDTEGDATETEESSTQVLRPKLSHKRMSYMSTASDSGDEDEDDIVGTPVRSTHQPKYKLRLSRGARRSSRVSDNQQESPHALQASPSSSMGTPQPAGMQSLGDELDALDDDSVDGTPVSERYIDGSFSTETPTTERHASVEPGTPSTPTTSMNDHEAADVLSSSQVSIVPVQAPPKPAMVDAGVMTEPWLPEPVVEQTSLLQHAGEVAAGALAGFGLSRATGSAAGEDASRPPSAHTVIDESTSVETGSQPAADIEKPAEPVRTMVTIGTDARGVPVTFSTGTDARIIPMSSIGTDARVASTSHTGTDARVASTSHTGTDARAPVQTVSIGTDARGKPVTISIGTGTDPESKIQTLLVEQLPHAPSSMDRSPLLSPSTELELWPLPPNQKRMSVSSIPKSAVDEEKPPVPSMVPPPPPVQFAFSEILSQDWEPVMPELPPPPPPMFAEGSQTLVSGAEIDSMIKNKRAVSRPSSSRSSRHDSTFKNAAAAATLALADSTPANREGHSADDRPSVYESPALYANARRPSSSGSMRKRDAAIAAPPLPADHNIKIAAAQVAPSSPEQPPFRGNMGPPAMPASAYKRPNTPSGRPPFDRALHSRDSNTPRQVPSKDKRGTATIFPADRVSHRTSVSSFASELDERFNIARGGMVLPPDVAPATDPRMIQAITQTMIGEYLWKYTRKTGRSETSTTRHRRFFWVHPYTRTLYWSEHDPSTAGKNMMKAKSVAIEAVRVISDDNAYPPGLHRKSIVVITPGREIVFTAPTGQRHETWFNALSYLLLRTDRENKEAEDTMSDAELDEFNPHATGVSGTVRRNINRLTGGTTNGRSISRQSRRTSLSSYNSRTTRNTSPQRQEATVTGRTSAASNHRGKLAPTAAGTLRGTSSNPSRLSTGSQAGGRFSSMASRFRSSSAQRTTSALSHRKTDPCDPATIYDASVVGDSAEDMRAVIERQEREAARLENVRACCDGKHDVGSLKNRSATGKNRHSGAHHHHPHAHGTASSRA
ncbi:Anucleate primary sterigmata protein A [Cercospora zeina]